MTITKTFEFPGVEHERNRKAIRTEVTVKEKDGTERVEKFELRNDLSGIELLEHIAASSPGQGSTRGVYLFLARIVKDEDWDRFTEALKGSTPKQIGAMAGDLIDVYSSFPTSGDDGSSGG